MSNTERNHKDNVFCLLYRDKKNLLSLYNAMNDTSYENEEELKKIASPGRLHRTTKVRIPVPRFVVFYNGSVDRPERMTYRLSELFSREEKEPELELVVTAVNINPGCSRELLYKCESLGGYMAFVEKVRNKLAAELKVEEAVRQSVNECISENILEDFFREHREEIVEMGIFEFDQELHDRVLREDGEAIGIEKGIEKGIEWASLVFHKVQDGETDNIIIAKSIGCAPGEVEKIRKQFRI